MTAALHLRATGAALATLIPSLVIAGCRGEPVSGSVPSATASAAAVSTNASAVASGTASKPAPNASAKSPSPEEIAALAKYKAALGRGRAASKRHDLAAAVAAFNEALAAIPGDARALAERGFAKLDADPEGAAADLDEAHLHTADPALISAIWFNTGLLHERAGRAEPARSSFAIAHHVKPSAAAAKKLEGKSSCPVQFRTDKLEPLKAAASWQELFKLAGTNDDADTSEPTDEARARALVCKDGQHEICNCSKDPLRLERDYGFYQVQVDLAFARRGGGFWFTQVGRVGGWPARCTGGSDASGRVEDGVLVVTETNDGIMSVSKDDNDEGNCSDGLGWTIDSYYDAATGRAYVMLDREADVKVTVRAEKGQLIIKGAGCNEHIPLGR